MTPAVSVVIPTYNQPLLLKETLATVIAQTFLDYEIVVVNDGSTDDTAEQLSAYAASLGPAAERLRIINQENRGIGAARNRGIDESRGKYVALLDHDDLWKPRKLQVQVDYLENHPECIAATVPWSTTRDPDRCVFDRKLARADGIIERPLYHLAHGQLLLISSSLMFHRERAMGLRYETRPRCIEDTPFQIGLFARGAFGVAGDEILMVYRWHQANYSSQAAFFYNGIRMLRELDAGGRFAEVPPAARKDLLHFLAHVGRTAAVRQLIAGERGGSLRTYLQELPFQIRDGAIRFLAAFPALTALPQTVLRRRFAD